MGTLTAFVKKYIPLWAFISRLVGIASGVILLLAANLPRFADGVNSTVSVAIRFILSSVTFLFPFSVFELLVLLALPLLCALIVLSLRGKLTRVRCVRNIFSVTALLSIIFSSFVFTLGVGYRTTDVSDKMSLNNEGSISPEELLEVALLVREEINGLVDEIEFYGGESHSGYTVRKTSALLCDAYDNLYESYPVFTSFESRVKPVTFSGVMSDAGITGIYSFFTGEANVNTAYPDFSTTFTIAHEMAHQRGFARENEANFVAFLACIHSDDPYIRYSGYLYIYRYLMSDLYRASRELHAPVRDGLDNRAREDVLAANAVAIAHSNKKLGEISDKVNDSYLQMNGTEGIVTYGYVVRLAVVYYRK